MDGAVLIGQNGARGWWWVVGFGFQDGWREKKEGRTGRKA